MRVNSRVFTKLITIFRKPIPLAPTVVSAVITFHHINHEGDLWVDWTNELGKGKGKVWRVITIGGKYQTQIGETGNEEKIDNFIVCKTIHSQIFTTFILTLTELRPIDTCRQIEPSYPYNILGVKKLTVLRR